MPASPFWVYDPQGQAPAAAARERGFGLRYREVDPDVFGEELVHPHYDDVDRIALVGAVLDRP